MAAQGSTPPAAPAPFEGDAFVGTTDDPSLFAAVVVGTDEARAYLCDGTSLVTWFTGVAGDALDLQADDGSTLTATLTGTDVEGEAHLADGRAVTFAAHPATGIEGLYEVVVAEGRVTGAAAGGLRLEGVVAGKLPDGTLLLAGAVALPTGGPRPLAVFATPDAAGEQRWIVLGNGQVTGGFKRGGGSGFADPIAEFVPARGASFIDQVTDN